LPPRRRAEQRADERQRSALCLYAVRQVLEATNYLMISALAMDTSPGACAALKAGRCSVHDRRPLGCRTVPFHYSLERELDRGESATGDRQTLAEMRAEYQLALASASAISLRLLSIP
jgi:Fe-S-cluster containining protein